MLIICTGSIYNWTLVHVYAITIVFKKKFKKCLTFFLPFSKQSAKQKETTYISSCFENL